MLTCPKCSFQNELGRIFCHQCGTKLDLDQITASNSSTEKIRRKRRMTPLRILRRAVDITVVALVVWVIYLLFQVPDIRPLQPTNADLLAADNKRLALEQVELQNRAGTVEITAAELNGFIGSMSFDKGRGKGMEVKPVVLRAELGDGVITLDYVSEMHVGSLFSKKLYLGYTGVPAVQDGFFDFEGVAASIGDLPIHPKILDGTTFIQDTFARLFVKYSHERNLLDQLASVSVDKKRILLTYKPKSTTH